ncbi:MAG: putative Ig domain-containing protein [Verrucomicrobiota bacterium]
MRTRFWFLLSLLLLLAAFVFWRLGDLRQRKAGSAPQPAAAPGHSNATGRSGLLVTQPAKKLTPEQRAAALAEVYQSTNYPHRLSNTRLTPAELERSDRAILLRNAMIDTGSRRDLAIPDDLRAQGDPGSYIVQARGQIDRAFRAQLQTVNALEISYVPNNALLMKMSAAAARTVAGLSRVRVVIPYEPYYKLEMGLLEMAVEKRPLPVNRMLRLTVFPGEAQSVLAPLEQMDMQILGEDRSPFGPQYIVSPGRGTLAALAALPQIQGIEPYNQRVALTDLMRVRLGVATNSVTLNNYQGLTGSNVWVTVNDVEGVDPDHPDLTNRVFHHTLTAPTDFSGHPTHVAGIIAGGGTNGPPGNTVPGSTNGANFRGMAPQAMIFSQNINTLSDAAMAEDAALTNLFVLSQTNRIPVANNSWGYETFAYDSAAAIFDGATRDAVPGLSGAQQMIFVFAAGNSGFGSGNGQGGVRDSIDSPGTMKNGITVGAFEQARDITNDVITLLGCTLRTNADYLPLTDSSNEVVSFSSRGPVGYELEGQYGRFKPDLVAPGTFVVGPVSSTWNSNAYYNPTTVVDVVRLTNVISFAGETNAFLPIFVPNNALSLTIELRANSASPSPMPIMEIYTNITSQPASGGAANLAGTNLIVITNFGTNCSGDNWFYEIVNTNAIDVNYNLIATLATTNYPLTTLSNLNSQIGPLYRFESGTSMAAPAVSGLLALMQEYLERLGFTNYSPALLKALLINGALPLDQNYSLDTKASVNHQGWGRPYLPTTIPEVWETLGTNQQNLWPVQFVDQNPTNALATGQSHVYTIGVQTNSTDYQLRVTLVWTDPPGNPAVGKKLVNDLDLIVTNLTTGEVYYGNDFPSGGSFTQPNMIVDVTGGGNPPQIISATATNDSVNNVENVYLPGNLGTNLAITVRGRAVNVNALTGHTNDVVQDYALVVASGNVYATNAAISFVATNATMDTNPPVVFLQNSTNATGSALYSFLKEQRIGASSPLNTSTNGTNLQWRFYVFTNEYTNASATITNLSFRTFYPPNLSVARNIDLPFAITPAIGPNGGYPLGRNADADLDLYVSTDPDLTNLVDTVVDAALKSTDRGGTEIIRITNPPAAQVYYVGVKSEDQQAAEFRFLALVTDVTEVQQNPDGSYTLRPVPVPADIPDGSPDAPGGVEMFATLDADFTISAVVVTNVITHELFGDLLGQLHHDNGAFVVLNDHNSFLGGQFSGTVTNIYDDRLTNNPAGSGYSDGPGSLLDFAGRQGQGTWTFTMVDDALSFTGRVDDIIIHVTPQPLDDTGGTSGSGRTNVNAGETVYFGVVVPPEAISLTLGIGWVSGTGPLDLYVRYDDGTVPRLPGPGNYDHALTNIFTPGDSLTISRADIPPLVPGRWLWAVSNAGPDTVTFDMFFSMVLDYVGNAPRVFNNTTQVTIFDEAHTNANAALIDTSSVFTNNETVAAINKIGVRIEHERPSDLDIRLLSPSGTAILLMESRGWGFTNGIGMGTNRTELALVAFSEDTNTTFDLIKHVNPTNDPAFLQFITPTNVATTYMTDEDWTVDTAASAGGVNESRYLIPTGTNHGRIQVYWLFYVASDQLQIIYEGTNILYDTGVTNNTNSLINFTPTDVDTATDTINIANAFVTDDDVGFASAGTLPGGLVQGVRYFIINETATSFQVSLTQGGPAVDLTSAGNGLQYVFEWESSTTIEYNGTSDVVEIVVNPGSTNSPGTIWDFQFQLFDLADVAYSYTGSNSAQRAKSVAIRDGSLYLAGMTEALATNGLMARFAIPMQSNALPIYSLNWPDTRGGTEFRGVATTSEGVYAAGDSYTETTDTNSTKETKGVVVKFPFTAPAINTYGVQGSTWHTQVPTNSTQPGAFAFGGIEKMNAITTAEENGVEYIYVTGYGQFDATNPGRLYLSKLTNDGTVVWTTNDSALVAGEPFSSGQAIVVANNNIFVAGLIADSGGTTTNAYIAKFDTNGAMITTNILTVLSEYKGLATYNGELYAVGVQGTALSGSGAQFLVVKFDENLNILWGPTNYTVTSGGDEDILNGIVAFGDRLYAVGSTRPAGGDSDGILLEIDQATGALITRGTYPGYQTFEGYSANPGDDVFYGAATDGFDLYVVGEGRRYDPTVRTDPDAVIVRYRIKNDFFPEEPLSLLVGEAASGQWRLLITDTRTGATNTSARLLGWQIQMQTAVTNSSALRLTPFTTLTNTLRDTNVSYFIVDVPYTATWADNIFTVVAVTGSGLINVWHDQSGLPDVTTAPNVLTASGSATVRFDNTTPTTPVLVPGQRYYLAVQNANAGDTNTLTIRVDFDNTGTTYATMGASFAGTATTEKRSLFQFQVLPGDAYATVELTNLTADVRLLLRRNALPTQTAYDLEAVVTGTNFASLTLQPTGTITNLVGTWYLAAYKIGATDPTFDLRVMPPNTAATIAPVGDRVVDESQTLSFIVTATDDDRIENKLTYSLSFGPPGATIDPDTGVFVWATTEADGPGVYPVTVTVTDDGVPVQSSSHTFNVTVNEINSAPTLPGFPLMNTPEGQLFTLSAAAADSDLPANTLTYSFIGSVPQGAALNPQTGSLTWTPSEAQGPGSYTFTVQVVDNGQPPLSSQTSFTLVVQEANSAPVVAAIADKTVNENFPLTFNVSATDPDLPANSLTYSLGSGAPAGATINANTGAFSWTPSETDGGSTFAITVIVTDNGSPTRSSSATFNVTVNEINRAPILNAIANQGVNEGSTLTVTAVASDTDIPAQTVTFSLGSGAPAGATINPSSGAFSWATTEAHGPGVYPITIIATDNGTPPASSSRTFNVTVNEVNTAPALAAIPNATVNEGTALTFTASGTDADVPAQSLAYSLVTGFPAGATINSTSGAFSWTPAEAQGPGTYNITVRVADSGSPSLNATRTFTVTVNEVNVAPVLAAIANQSVNEGSTLNVTASATDADLPVNSLTYSLDTAPTGMTINASSGAIAWTPTESQGPGTHNVTVRVTDNGSPAQSATRSFTVTVGEGNVAPSIAVIEDATVDEGTPFTLNVVATDADEPAQTLTFALDEAPEGMSIDAAGVITWSPSEAQGPSTNDVVVRVTDNGSPAMSATRAFQITVNEVNTPPVLATIANQTIDEGALLSIDASATDTDLPANALSYALENAPTGMTINASSGAITWTPTEAQGPGSFNLTVRVTDNGTPAISTATTFTVNVAEVNNAPVLAAIPAQTVNEESPLSVTASATDSDNPIHTVTYSLENAPTGMTINASSGAITWTPTEGQGPGTYNVTVRATDNGSPNLSSAQTMVVHVNEVNLPPTLDAIANPDPVDEDSGPHTVNLTGITSGSAGESQTLVITATSGDTNIISHPVVNYTSPSATGTLTYTLVTNAFGAATITVTVDDGGNANTTITRTFTVTVNSVNDEPVITFASPTNNAALKAGETIAITADATDVDGTVTKVEFFEGANKLGESTTAPFTFNWSPVIGTYSLTLKATDNEGATKTSEVAAVTVNPAINTTAVTPAGDFEITFTGVPGVTYVVQVSTDLENWTDLTTVTGTGNQVPVIDPQALNVGQRFYRLIPRP